MSKPTDHAASALRLEAQLAAIRQACEQSQSEKFASAEQALDALRTKLNAVLNFDSNELDDSLGGARFTEGYSHKGLNQHRLHGKNRDGRDSDRERALADMWEGLNAEDSHQKPILATLLAENSADQIWAMKMGSPYTQAAATAAATAIQYLGTPVGFSQLERALKVAGYSIIDDK